MSGKAARVGRDANPSIDPQGCRRFIESGEARFRMTLAEQRAGKTQQ